MFRSWERRPRAAFPPLLAGPTVSPTLVSHTAAITNVALPKILREMREREDLQYLLQILTFA